MSTCWKALRPWPYDLTRAFTAAAVHGHIPVLELFFSENDSTRLNRAAFQEIAERGNRAVIEFLVQRYDETDAGELLCALARVGRTDLVQLILGREIEESAIVRALGEAAGSGSYDTVEFLFARCPRRERSRTPFFSADALRHTIREGSFLSAVICPALDRSDARLLGIILQRGSPYQLRSALSKAAKTTGNRDAVTLLLDACEARNSSKLVFLFAVGEATGNAISCGDVEVAEILLSKCDEYAAGRALRSAVKMNHIELVETCAGKSDQLHIIGAMVQAAQGKQVGVLDALMKYVDDSSFPADVDIAALKPILTQCDPTLYPAVFTSAAERGCLPLIDYLQNEMDTHTIQLSLRSAASNGHTEVVSALLRDSDLISNRCALEAAARNGQVKVVALLRGVSDAEGISSALESARKVGCEEVVSLLSGKKPRLG